jgi:ATP-dependent DNA ligase
MAHFEMLHSRAADHLASACAFDLLMLNGDDLRSRRNPHKKSDAADN